MALKSLFDLDPTKYGIKPGAGAFRRVGEASRQLSLSELLQGLTAPTFPENVPTVTPLTEDQLAQVNRWPTDFTGFATQYANMSNAAKIGMTVDQAKAALSRGGTGYDYALNARKKDWAAEDEIWQQYLITEQYKAAKAANEGITSGYNKQVADYNAVMDPYKTKLDEYKTEREERAKNYNTSALNPELVTKKHTETTGERLAESDLYSENLHSLMIDRISNQPMMDEVSSLFSGAKGK